MKRKQIPQSLIVTIEELDVIKQRVQEFLPEEEAKIVINIIETHQFICSKLEEKNVQLKRLLQKIFGIKTEKSKNIINHNNGNEGNIEATNSKAINSVDKSQSDSSKNVEEDETTKRANSSSSDKVEDKARPKKGHGKIGVNQYSGAEEINISHPNLKNGDPCPECLNGKVYQQSPGVFIYIQGRPPVDATIYKTEKLRCNLCGAIFSADLPNNLQSDPYVRKYYDETAKAVIAILRYGYGLPLNRIEKLQQNFGIPLSMSTQWDKIEETADLIYPVYNALKEFAAQGEILYNDDTMGKILEVMKDIEKEKEAGIKGRTGIFTTSIICVVGEKKIGIFITGRQHAGENARDILALREEDRKPPIIMSDAKSGNIPKDIEVIASNCNTHARRHFVDILEDYPSECHYVIIGVYGEIYKNEKIAKENGMCPEERLKFHQENSGPIMNDFHIWLNAQFEEKLIEPNSSLGKANTYVLNHWEKLTCFLRVPGAPIDNNICERAIKTAICHRKNSLFYKNKHGAYIGDMFMSLIHTCNLNGVNAFDYLTELQKHSSDVFKNPSHFLPWNYASAVADIKRANEHKIT